MQDLLSFVSVPLAGLHAAGLLVLLVYSLGLLAHAWLAQRPARIVRGPLPADEHLPTICVQLPIYNERHVVRRAIRAAAALDWPADRLEIQVLDDSTDDTTLSARAEIEALAARGVRIRHLRRGRRHGFKAGALAEGLIRTEAELVAILDTDFVPPTSFLRECAATLLTDPDLAYVQARWGHLNATENPLTRLQALVIDAHFLVEQAARHAAGLILPFNGTCGVWRREAIESAGGWRHQTLTEDLDLSLRAHLAGWRAAFRADLVVPGELPGSLQAWRTQQFRWTKGFAQVTALYLATLWRSELGFGRKLAATVMMTNWLVWPATVLVLASAVALAGIGHDLATSPAAALGAVTAVTGVLGTAAALLVGAAQSVNGHRVAALLRLPAVLAFNAGLLISNTRAVVEALGGVQSPFVRTPKRGGATSNAYPDLCDTGVPELGAAGGAMLALLAAPELWSPFLAVTLFGLSLSGALLGGAWLLQYARAERKPSGRVAPRPGGGVGTRPAYVGAKPRRALEPHAE